MNFVELKEQASAHWQAISAESCCIFVDPASTCASNANAAVYQHLIAEIERFKLNARVIPTGSLGWREISPVIAIQKPASPRVYYANVTPGIVSQLIQSVIIGNDFRPDLALAVDSESEFHSIPPVAKLPFFSKQTRRLLQNCGRIHAEDIDHAIASGAYAGLHRALSTPPDSLLKQIAQAFSEQQFRGWNLCHDSLASEKYVVAKVAEGGTFSKDVFLLEGDPHAALEGLLIAAHAVGARRALVCIDPRDTAAKRRVQVAIEQMQNAGLAGNPILGSSFNCIIEVRDVQRGLGGEEDSILVNFLEGRPARASAVFPPIRDHREHTVVETVETLARISAFLRGDSQAVHTRLLSVAGDLRRTGVVEISVSATLQEIVQEIAGGAPEPAHLKAVQIGAPYGGWVPATHLDLALDQASLAGAGCSLGSGSLFAADTRQCMIALARAASGGAHHASCGQCTFGREGTRQLVDVLTAVQCGRAKETDLDLLANISDSMKLGCLCANGRNAPDAVLTTLQHFRDEYEAHVSRKQCPTEVCEMK